MGDGGAASAHDLLGVDGDTLTDMLAGFSFVYHGDGVIGIADEAFAFGIGGEFLAGQPVGSGTFTLGLEVGGGADVGPLHVVAVAQQIEGGDMCCGDRFVGVKELRSVLKGLVCALFTNRLPAPPTTISRMSVPESRSAR